MSRSDDARLFFDMYWRGDADMYAEPVSRANAGDPFWWAALTIIAEDGHVFSGRPVVQYVDYYGEGRQVCGRTVLPLFHTWGFSKRNADRLVIGTLQVPSDDTDIGYIVKPVQYPKLYRLYQSILKDAIDIARVSMASFKTDTLDPESFRDIIDSVRAVLDVECRMFGEE